MELERERALIDACNGLKAIRVTERKKNAEILKDFLTGNAVPSLLTNNTLERKEYTWNSLFEDIKEYIFKETEKYETSKTFDSVTRPLCTSLLQLCVLGSIKGKAYVKCEKILESCLFVFNNLRLYEAVGDCYLNLLYKCVLPCEYYLGYIQPSTWQNLLDVCVAVCSTNQSKLDTFTKLRLILLILKSIKENSQLIKPVVDTISLLEAYFLMISNDTKVQDVVSEIIALLLEMLSADYRLTMCGFIEKMLPAILSFYKQNKDQNKKRVLFKLLYYTVKLHHPLGRHHNEEGSLAHNWEQWRKHLNSITELICLEVNYIKKCRQPSDRVLQKRSYFYELAAAVYYQVFMFLEQNYIDDESATKRLKLNFNNNKTFSDIINELQQNHIPWIAIVHVYVKKYGGSIPIYDYLSLLNCLQTVWSNNSNNLDWDIFQKLTCLVLQNVNILNYKSDEYDNTLISMWNSCLRYSTTTNASHNAIHKIMQSLLMIDTVRDSQVTHLIKLYIEKDMPVTSHSVMTLNKIMDQCYSKCSIEDFRGKCFSWLTTDDISNICAKDITELFLRLNANECVEILSNCEVVTEYEKLRDILFNSNEKCIMFSEFEIDISNKISKQEMQFIQIESESDMDNQLKEYFKSVLMEIIIKLRNKELELLLGVKLINIVISYLDLIIKYHIKSRDEVEFMDLYALLKEALTSMYSTFTILLQCDGQIAKKINALQALKELLISEFDELFTIILRSCIDSELFYAINCIINTTVPSNDTAISISGDEDEINFDTLKHNCFFVLAAYCRKQSEYRQEILNLLLDESVYNFDTDLQCMIHSLEILTDSEVEDPPFGSIFTLMQCMCRKLYRNSKASYYIIKILVKIIDKLCSRDSTMKENCIIMIKSYLKLCIDMYYPPKLAALVYECVAILVVLNRKQDIAVDSAFECVFMNKIKGNVHSMRLYCCYLLRLTSEYCVNDVETVASDLLDVFLIDVSNYSNELILKDESANRTSTVLHCFLALAQSKRSAIQTIILEIIHLQKTKSLDKNIVLKVLQKIVNSAGISDLQAYLNIHILPIIHFWFTKNHTLEELPIDLFGYDDVDRFIENHRGWLVAGDILWRKQGRVAESDVLKYVANIQGQSVQNVLEICFPNINILALPYVVSDNNNIEFYPFHRTNEFKIDMKYAHKMFKDTCNILEHNKWSDLFLENLWQLVLLATTHLRDWEDAENMFGVKLSQQLQYFYYPKRVFSAILDYFKSLIDKCVIKYLCTNQTIKIIKILFQLWKNVTQENIFEWKVLALYAYVTFLTNIPMDVPSDAFVCNFACNSFTDAIKHCADRNEMQIYVRGLKIVLDYFLPHLSCIMCKSVLELLPVLVIKNEGGFEQECSSLLHYLLDDMKDYLKEGEDDVDFINSMSQGVKEIGPCSNVIVFQEKLRGHKISLTRPSHDTLLNIKRFLICNKDNIQLLYHDVDSKRFSEDCATSLLHQIIHSLCNIMKSASDEKTIIEACNCLSEISSYDLKTLVTVPPAITDGITMVDPKHYFAQVIVKTLLAVFFDEDPNVTNEVADTLMNLLKCLDINNIAGLEGVDKQILKPLSPENILTNDTNVDEAKFELYYTMLPDGIFLNALLNKSSDDWLKEVTCTLLDFLNSQTNYVNNLRQVCILKSHVCRKILPAVIGLLVQCLSESHVQAVGEHINKLFTYIYEQTFHNNSSQNSTDVNVMRNTCGTLPDGYKTIVQYMLDIVDFVRVQRNHYTMRPGGAKKLLNYFYLEYDKVAWAASVVDQNWAAIYYGELWAMFQNNGLAPCSPEVTTNLSNGEKMQHIFRKCYLAIGEIDAIEGCGSAHLTIESEKQKYLINTEQYSDALLLHDIALSCGTQSDQELQYGVVRSLYKSGMHHLALRYIKSLPENEQLDNVKYECLTSLGDWSHFVDVKQLSEKYKQKHCDRNLVVKTFQYACLKNCLHIQTAPEFGDKLLTPLNNAKLAVSRLCHNLNMENCQNIYKILEKLHMFRDIEDYFTVRSNRMQLFELLQKWDVENLPPFHDFKHIEALSSQRVLILEHAVKSHDSLLSDIVSLQLKYAKMALNNNRIQMAQRLLSIAKKSLINEDITLVESEISWAKGHKELALSLLRNVVNKQSLDVKLAAISLRRYALWMADSKRDNPRDIINKYLQKSLNVLQEEHVDVRLKVYRDIAKFADTEYKQVVAYMNSSTFENRVKCVENMKGTETDLKNRPVKSLSKEEGRALSTNRRFKEIDEAEIANTRAERENFLHLAMRYYLLSLKHCNNCNLSVFRVISLWLDNREFRFPSDGSDTFEDLLHAIPSWKFVTILPQLAPRLTNEDTVFMQNLKQLLKRCAAEHPHHALPILFLLKNSDKDNVILNASGRFGSGTRSQDQAARVTAAAELIDELRHQDNEDLTLIIEQMEIMYDAIISFANHVPPLKTKKQKIPDAENIHKLRKLSKIPVPTVTLPIQHDCKYNYINVLLGFEKSYELVGGVNCPKKILCKDSSGKNHILLIKGGDDLKQDAVMQQVFNIVNTLLEKDPVTNKNKLLIKTYKVVPLSRLSGVLEWCDGTVPLGAYLVGTNNSGAHGRYRPQDISCDAARKKMISCREESNEVKLSVYNSIIKEFKPVFHYFFTEHYLDPVTWYERRLAYTKSVATSSMVGYILGLGDRHLFNILIDQQTAEVIHIDLGIAFDQGKTLRTPETVPFRLTRDIIAGFGCSGTEGIFRRCCEKTMQLLRDNQETLLTILQVLLCDPLYSWSVKTAQQNAPTSTRSNRALSTSGTPNGLAKRALLVVTSKLSGTEEGVAGGVAVAGQVAQLLHIATDPFNLCRLFDGWQPYL